MRRQFFVTDLDGTLLNSAAGLSQYTVRVFTAAVQQGHVVSFATARSIVSAGPLVSDIPWQYPLITYNGAIILDSSDFILLDGFFLDTDLARSILDMGRIYGMTPFVFLSDQVGRETVFHEVLRNEGQKGFRASRYGDPRFRPEVGRIEIPAGQAVIQLQYIDLEEQLMPLREQILAWFGSAVRVHFVPDIYLKGYYFLQIFQPQADKEYGLRSWSSLVNCAPEDITVFGDNLNDLGLFEIAGTRIAVANAHAEIKSRADYVVESNDQDGVARYMATVLGLNNTAGEQYA